jgi:tetratricopeptide (TPR) repeat protein
VLDDHQEAARIYLSKPVRPTDEKIAATVSPDQRRVDTNAKRQATYLLGLLSYDDGKFDVAADWFSRPELRDPDSPAADGARYNLARSLEAQGKLEEAIPLLENDTSAQSAGNKIRARDLKALAAEKAKAKPSVDK